VAYGIGVGYLTHLILDSLTRSGVQPFHPLAGKIRGPLKTGGLTENALHVLGVVVSAIYYLS
jgi:hypothetical protein